MARRDQLNGQKAHLVGNFTVLTQWSLQKENLMSTCKKLLLQIVMAPQQH